MAAFDANVSALNKKLAADKAALATAQTAQAAAQTADQAGKAKQTQLTQATQQAQQNTSQAQTALATAKANEATYNQKLASTLKTNYINNYAHAVDYARETNTAINLNNLINPTTLYNQYSIAGTSVSAPTTDLAGSGITFDAAGNPIISTSLQKSARAARLATSKAPTTGGGASTKPAANTEPTQAVAKPMKSAAGSRGPVKRPALATAGGGGTKKPGAIPVAAAA